MGNHKVLYINLHVYFEFFAYFCSCFMVMVSLASNQLVLKFQKLERRLITLILFLFYLTFSSIISFFFSDEISTFLTMVSKLGYDEKPNYTKYKEVFKGGLKKLGVKDEWKLSLPISGPANKVILPASLYLLFNKLICKLHFVTKCRLRKKFYFDYLVRICLKRYKTWLTLVLIICN